MLDIDRDRQRISLGLKQTQEDPWQRVVDTYNIGDELEGNVTKVVTFGAFVEILDGVEGLVHISELAQHHVENPREIIQPGDPVRVKILEIDSERRRLSLSIKRVEGQVLPVRPIVPPAERRRGATSTTCPSSASPRTCSPAPTSPSGTAEPRPSRRAGRPRPVEPSRGRETWPTPRPWRRAEAVEPEAVEPEAASLRSSSRGRSRGASPRP